MNEQMQNAQSNVADLTAFRQMLEQDEGLQSRVQEATNITAVALLAKDCGFSFSEQDVIDFVGSDDVELTDFELELVSAGFVMDIKNSNT